MRWPCDHLLRSLLLVSFQILRSFHSSTCSSIFLPAHFENWCLLYGVPQNIHIILWELFLVCPSWCNNSFRSFRHALWKSRNLLTLNLSSLPFEPLHHLPQFQPRRQSPHILRRTVPSPPSPPIPPHLQPPPMPARPSQHRPADMDTFAHLVPSSPSQLDTVTAS